MAERISTTTSIKLNDAVVCSQHLKEQCKDCDVDSDKRTTSSSEYAARDPAYLP